MFVPPAVRETLEGNVAVNPSGEQSRERLTFPANPFKLCRVTVDVIVGPVLDTVRGFGLAATEKVGEGGPGTVTYTVVKLTAAPPVPITIRVNEAGGIASLAIMTPKSAVA